MPPEPASRITWPRPWRALASAFDSCACSCLRPTNRLDSRAAGRGLSRRRGGARSSRRGLLGTCGPPRRGTGREKAAFGRVAHAGLGHGSAEVDGEGADRPGDVLQLLLALVGEGGDHAAADHAAHGVRHRDAARRGQAFQPRGDVHAIAVDRAVGLLDDVAQMHADAKVHAPCLRRRSAWRGPAPAGSPAPQTTAPVAVSNTASTESPAMSMTRPWCASICALNTARAASSAATVACSSSAIRREKPAASAARMALSRCLTAESVMEGVKPVKDPAR